MATNDPGRNFEPTVVTSPDDPVRDAERPSPKPLDYERLYDEVLHDGAVTEDNRSNLEYFRPRHVALLRAIDELLPPESRDAIADVGTHDAFFLRLASSLGFRRLIAADLFPLPKEETFVAGASNYEMVETNFNQPSFLSALGDESIDCIVSAEVFEHLLHHPFGYLEESWRVLRPGGLFLLTTPNPCTAAKALKLLRGESTLWNDEGFAMRSKTSPDFAVWDTHFREYPAPLMRSLLEQLPGARIEDSGFIGAAPVPEESQVRRIAKRTLHALGLADTRLLSASQYVIVRKAADFIPVV